MAITEAFSGTETITTTEHSLTTDTAGPDVETSDGVFQVFLDLNALGVADEFELRGYEKVLSGSTQRRFMRVTLSRVQVDANFVTPSLILLHGWDFTLIKIAGTDRSIDWSIRKVA